MGILSSSIGKKYVMGVAGAVWTLFVFGHMAGNMLIFVSPQAFNAYGHAIVSNKPLLYGTEVILSLCLLTHVILGIMLTLQNRKAKPQKYAVAANEEKKARFASSWMAAQGTMILLFIIYHIKTFKLGTYYEVSYDGVVMRDLHRLVVESFANPAYVGWYLVCLVLLGIHLSHGAYSVFQSLGVNHPSYTPTIKTLSRIYGLVVAAGFISQPVYVFFFA